MKKTLVVSGAAVAACVAALAAVLVLRPWDGAGAPAAGGDGGAGPEAPPGAVDPQAAGTDGEAVEEPRSPGAGTEPEAAAAKPSFLSDQNRREIVLFFQESESEYLGPERRKIFLTNSLTDQAKQIVIELINGPQNPDLLPTLPRETQVRGLYLDRSGTAYVDLSGEVESLHPGGTAEEIGTIFSLVNSLTYNLPDIRRVHLLVEGEERETLKHLDLRRDYRQDLSIVDMGRVKSG